MRRSLLSAVAALVVSGIAFIGSSSPCLACSCVDWGPAEVRAESAIVITGTVLAVDEVSGRDYPDLLATIAIDRQWKGQPTSTVDILTDTSECSTGWEVGKRYLVYGQMFEGALHTSICSRTRYVDAPHWDDIDDFAVLGPGSPPHTYRARHSILGAFW